LPEGFQKKKRAKATEAAPTSTRQSVFTLEADRGNSVEQNLVPHHCRWQGRPGGRAQ